MHGILGALDRQQRGHTHIIIARQGGVSSGQHRQVAGEMWVAGRERVRPALFPAALECLELRCKRVCPLRHRADHRLRLWRMTIPSHKLKHLLPAGLNGGRPAPADDAIVMSHRRRRLCRADSRGKTYPLRGVEHRNSIRLQLARHRQRQLDLACLRSGIGNPDPHQHRALLVDHPGIALHDQSAAVRIASQRPVGIPTELCCREFAVIQRQRDRWIAHPQRLFPKAILGIAEKRREIPAHQKHIMKIVDVGRIGRRRRGNPLACHFVKRRNGGMIRAHGSWLPCQNGTDGGQEHRTF